MKKAPPRKKQKKPDENAPQPFLKRLLFGEEKLDLSELESGSTTILTFFRPPPLIRKAVTTS